MFGSCFVQRYCVDKSDALNVCEIYVAVGFQNVIEMFCFMTK